MILAFDTSGPYVTASLWDGANIVADQFEEMPKGQAEALFDVLDSVLGKAGCAWSDLHAIGVGVGPGNFTGVRISVAAARGLSRSLDIPAHGVSLLEAVSFGATSPVLAVLKAPRDQVYVQGFGMELFSEPCLLAASDVDYAGRCIGSGAEAVAGVDQIELAVYATTSAIARIAAERKETKPPQPLYLRAPDAAPSKLLAPVLLS